MSVLPRLALALLVLAVVANAAERRSLVRNRARAFVCNYECTNGMSGAAKVVTPVTVTEPATVSCGRELYVAKAVKKCAAVRKASADQLCQNCKVAAAPAATQAAQAPAAAEPSKWTATQVGDFLALINGVHTTCADPVKCMVILGRLHYPMHSTDAQIIEYEAEAKGCKELAPTKFASCGPALTKQCKPMQLVLSILGDLHPAAGAVSKKASSECSASAFRGAGGVGSVWLYTARGEPGHHAILLQKSDSKFVFIQSWAGQYPISVSEELDAAELCKVFSGDATAVAKAFNLARAADFATQVRAVKFNEATIERVNAGSAFSFTEVGACMTRVTGSDVTAQTTSVKDCLLAKIKARPSSEGPMSRD